MRQNDAKGVRRGSGGEKIKQERPLFSGSKKQRRQGVVN